MVLPWTRDALYQVANMYLEDLKYPNMTPELKLNLVNMFVNTKEQIDIAAIKFK